MKVAVVTMLLLALGVAGCVYVGRGGSYQRNDTVQGTNKIIDLNLRP